VLLFAAGTDAQAYERALRAEGLPTYRATGRGYFGQQQVVDLLAYLRLLHNRYDDEALATVLASPFVGVSNDALVLIRRHAGRRPLFTGIERSLPEALSEEDERLVRAFKQRYERLVALSARASLEYLCEQIVCEHDYDLAVLARWDGRFGFKVVHPATGGKHAVFDYDRVRAAEQADEDAERLRLYYVAMTRAIDRLIVSGAVDRNRATPIGWVLSRLDCEDELT